MTCPVCSTPNAEVLSPGPTVGRVNCPRCGEFDLARSTFDDLPQLFGRGPFRPALMSHTIKRMQRADHQRITIDPTNVESFWNRDRLPTANEQADDLLLWVGDNQPDNATAATEAELALDAWIGSALPRASGNSQGLRWLIDAIEPDQQHPRLFHRRYAGGQALLQLTFAGWKQYAALKQTRSDSRTAFMAMKFGDAELNNVVTRCFRPAVERAGFELRIATDRQEAGLIDNQIRAALIAARFVVADLTHGSFGAYWEAGFADGRELPVIYTCRRREWEEAKTHFDTNHMTTVLWDVGNLRPSEDELTAIIRATLRSEARQTDE